MYLQSRPYLVGPLPPFNVGSNWRSSLRYGQHWAGGGEEKVYCQWEVDRELFYITLGMGGPNILILIVGNPFKVNIQSIWFGAILARLSKMGVTLLVFRRMLDWWWCWGFSRACKIHVLVGRIQACWVKLCSISLFFLFCQQTKYEQTNDHLHELITKHQTFNESLGKVRTWLQSAEQTLVKLLQEPIAAEPLAVQQQIDKLRVRKIEVISS